MEDWFAEILEKLEGLWKQMLQASQRHPVQLARKWMMHGTLLPLHPHLSPWNAQLVGGDETSEEEEGVAQYGSQLPWTEQGLQRQEAMAKAKLALRLVVAETEKVMQRWKTEMKLET